MTARWFGGIGASLDRKSDAPIILNPAFSSSRNVVSFLAYEVTTPGRSVVLLQPDAHCSRSYDPLGPSAKNRLHGESAMLERREQIRLLFHMAFALLPKKYRQTVRSNEVGGINHT